ncbi:MAG TPA: glycosyltransferase [Pyrinomonadaceae bacterium]
MSISTLYLCYFGVREPLVQTQVLPYLRYLAAAGVKVSLLTFEPQLKQAWSKEQLEEKRTELAAAGIRWLQLPYHKRPSAPATLYDIMAGARFAAHMVRREGIDVLHARSHIPMAMALLARRRAACKVIFDIRGLMAEEYSDAGVWRENSRPFRAVKKIERAGIRRADQIVVLTEKMRQWLVTQNLKRVEEIEVIPCCVDFERFDAGLRDEDEARGAQRFEVVYAGSVTGLYLLEEMGRFFMALREQRPEAFLRVLTVSSPTAVAEALERAGLRAEDFWTGSVSPKEVPIYLRRARLGISFRKPTFSQIAASPTKIPEYLAVGLPVVSNAGIGDMDELIERERVGVVLREFVEDAYKTAAEKALRIADDRGTRLRSARVARKYFALNEVGGARYLNVYRRLEEQQMMMKAETGLARV